MPTEAVVYRNLKEGDKKSSPLIMKLVVFFVLWLQNTQELEKSANFADFSYLAIKLAQKFCLSTPRQYRQLSLQSKTYIKVVLVHIKVFPEE